MAVLFNIKDRYLINYLDGKQLISFVYDEGHTEKYFMIDEDTRNILADFKSLSCVTNFLNGTGCYEVISKDRLTIVFDDFNKIGEVLRCAIKVVLGETNRLLISDYNKKLIGLFRLREILYDEDIIDMNILIDANVKNSSLDIKGRDFQFSEKEIENKYLEMMELVQNSYL